MKNETNDTFSIPKRWGVKNKLEVILKLFRGESIDDVSREVGVEIYRLEEWRAQALTGMESGFKVRIKDPLNKELARAKQHIGDLSMENELLHERIKKKGPFQTKRSK